jgi:hypothetical protein
MAQSDIARVESQFGRVLSLFRLLGRYAELRREIKDAPWKRRTNGVGPDSVVKPQS